MNEPGSDIPVGAWDPDAPAGAGFERARLQALAELEPLKEELRARARMIAEREAELELGAPATGTPDEALAQRARDLAAAEQAALDALKARARALDLRAEELARRARDIEIEGPLPADPGFVGFSEGFEAFADSRRKRRAPGR